MARKKTIFLTGASGNMGHEGFKQLLEKRDKFNLVVLVLPTEKDKKIMYPYETESGVKIHLGRLNAL
ncbi:hypothetical protein SFC66_08815 [Terribacillus saccharophilus]|uniref:hypothetical protein n=1 Tax=Terribacillus saccharophilus TaxID=361277 RepID=UPI003982181B